MGYAVKACIVFVLLSSMFGGAWARTSLDLAPCRQGVAGETRTIEGLYRVHAVCDKLLWELPRAVIGRELLVYTEFNRLWTTDSDLAPGSEADNRVMRWRRHGDAMFLELVNRKLLARGNPELESGLDRVQLGYIVKRFDIISEGRDGAPVIDVTSFFVGDAPSFGLPLKRRFGMSGVDPQRSFITNVKVFPDNVRIVFHQTWTPDSQRLFRAAGEDSERFNEDLPPSMQFQFTLNMVLLPREPMRARYWDARVGYFNVPYEEFGPDASSSQFRAFIMRYRLEKKDPGAPMSEPTQSIVFHISPEVPRRWRPYIKQGVEDWQSLFEAAGFKNAIIAKDAPTVEEDPTWDPEDARLSVIRWIPSTGQRALGPVLVDPRSGEVISARVLLWNDVLRLVETWYVTHAGPSDPRAATLPLPESLMGELLRYVVAHELGHTLGLRHNFKAASAYSVEQLRDPVWTKKWGTTASIMSYGRLNYVAQPGDGAGLLPRFGPYDAFAIHWGYHQMPAVSPEDEWPMLDRLAARQLGEPMLRFGGEDALAEVDPTVSTYVLGSDPMAAADLGLRNVDRVMDLMQSMPTQIGKDYLGLRDLYEALVTHRHRQLDAVARMVGGVEELRVHSGRAGFPFTPVDPAAARAAVRFIAQRGFSTPARLLDPIVLRRIVPEAGTDPLRGSNMQLLERLLDPAVFRRLAEATLIVHAGSGYLRVPTPYLGADLLRDLNERVFEELGSARVEIDYYRRELQRDYVHILITGGAQKKERPRTLESAMDGCALHDALAGVLPSRAFNSDLASRAKEARTSRERPSEYRAAVRGAVVELAQRISAAIPKARDRAVELHLSDLLKRLSP